jgi:ADP-heptose:LPS heptosyltransferase
VTSFEGNFQRLLVVRRDNIGDLVCTTPLLTALKRRFPQARLDVLVNSYNAPVLEGNPDVDRIHAYTKAKHLDERESRLAGYWGRVGQVLQLRRNRYDCVVLATPGWQPRMVRMARWLAPRHLLAFVPPGSASRAVDLAVPYTSPHGMHHVEDVFRLARALGIEGAPPPLTLRTHAPGPDPHSITIGMHLSARKPSQRWPEAHFVAAMRLLAENPRVRFRLFWAPGSETDRRHPGDDQKAARVVAATPGLPVEAIETNTLPALIAGLNGCDAALLSDGGAMHVAAALGKPVACFFGQSDASYWHPWGVPHRVLQPASREVADVSPEEAVAALRALAVQAAVAL